MSKKIIAYKMVSDALQRFNSKAAELVTDGWLPYGQMTTVIEGEAYKHIIYSQAFVKYES